MTPNIENLCTAIWLETAYNMGRHYDMSSDRVRPSADFVPRQAFCHIVTPVIEKDCPANEYWEAWKWVSRWIKSYSLKMVRFTFVRNGDYSLRHEITHLNTTPILEVRRVLANWLGVAPETLTYLEATSLNPREDDMRPNLNY